MVTKIGARAPSKSSKKVRPHMNDVMVDLETLSTRTHGVILSIGAVKFDRDSGEIDDEGFYASISIDSNLEYGRVIDEKTLIWWMGQSDEARKVFSEAKVSLPAALDSLWEWFGHNKRQIWSNGADFDIPMLADAFHALGMDPPWEFWKSRCVRTYRDLPIARRLEKTKPQIAHNALHDAIAQAKDIIKIEALLNGRKVAA